MYVLDLSCLFTFGMSTKFNRNISSFIIKVFVFFCLVPHLPLLTINKEEKYFFVAFAFSDIKYLLHMVEPSRKENYL